MKKPINFLQLLCAGISLLLLFVLTLGQAELPTQVTSETHTLSTQYRTNSQNAVSRMTPENLKAGLVHLRMQQGEKSRKVRLEKEWELIRTI